MSNEIKLEDLKAPTHCMYSKTNEWVNPVDDVKIGITDYAQAAMRGYMRDEHLQSIYIFGHLKPGDHVNAGDSIGEVNSSKATNDIYAPISGEIVEINGTLQHGVFLIPNQFVEDDPYGRGWLIRIRPTPNQGGLLSAEEYAEHCKGSH